MRELKERADSVLRGAVAESALAGAAAIAFNANGVSYEGAAGVRALGAAAAMDADTVCWIASMTKPLTSTAAVQLVERGALELDAPASEIVPALGEIQVFEGFDALGAPRLRAPKRAITLRHLLTHTSGLGYELFSDDVVKLQAALGLPGLGEGKLASLTAPLLVDPGERWEYGVSTDWVGALVEAASGMSLGAYLRTHIFEPLAMTHSGFAITADMRARLAGMAVRTPDGGLATFPFETAPGEFESGGGGLYSTARDYGRFVQAMLAGGRAIVGPKGMALLSQNQIGALRVTPLKTATPLSRNAEIFPGLAKAWSFAFQINLEPAPTGRPAGGLMWAGLSNCYFWIDQVCGLGGVVMAQLLPFADPRAMGVWQDFETAVYASSA